MSSQMDWFTIVQCNPSAPSCRDTGLNIHDTDLFIYRDTLVKIEKRVLCKDDDTTTGQTTSLSTIYTLVQQFEAPFTSLCEFIQSLKIDNIMTLINLKHTSTIGQTKQVYLEMLMAGNHVLARHIATFVTYGKLPNSKDKFMIQVNGIELSIENEYVPSFISLDKVNDILECGQTLILLDTLKSEYPSYQTRLDLSKQIIDSASIDDIHTIIRSYKQDLLNALNSNEMVIASNNQIAQFYLCQHPEWHSVIQPNLTAKQHIKLVNEMFSEYEITWTLSKELFWSHSSPRIQSQFVNDAMHEKLLTIMNCVLFVERVKSQVQLFKPTDHTLNIQKTKMIHFTTTISTFYQMECIQKNLQLKNDLQTTTSMILKDMLMSQGVLVIGKYILSILQQIESFAIGERDKSIDSSVSRLVRLLTGQGSEGVGVWSGLLARLDYNTYYSIGNGQ